MPNTYTQILFHIVFSTKNRERTLTDGHCDELYKYIWGIHQGLNCHLYRIGGVDDHVHILTGLPTTLAVAKYAQEIKAGSSHWLKSQPEFPRLRLARWIRCIQRFLSGQGWSDRLHQGSD